MRLDNPMRTRALLVLLVSLAAIVVLAGCAGRRGLGASQSWSGVVVAEAGDVAFVGTKDGRIIALDIEADDRGRINPRVLEEFDTSDRREESDGGRVGSAFYGTPVLAGDRIYAASFQGFVYSLSASPNSPLSDNDVGSFEIEGDDLRSKGIVGSVAVTDDEVVVGVSEDSHSGRLYVLERTELDENSSGSRIERCRYPARGTDPIGQVWSTPVVSGGVAYFGDLDHFFYAISLTDCKLVWEHPAELGGGVVAPPMMLGGRIYVGSMDRSFYAISASSGQVSKLFTADSWFWAGAATNGTVIYAPNLDGHLYAFDLDRSELLWSYDQEGGLESILSTPAVTDSGDIVLASDSGVFTLLDSDGEVLARRGAGKDRVRAPLTAVGNTVYAHSLDEIIQVFVVDGGDLDADGDLKLEGF